MTSEPGAPGDSTGDPLDDDAAVDDSDLDAADAAAADADAALGAEGPAGGAFALPPGADPSIDWGQRAHLHPDGSPRIIERHLLVPPELAGLRLDHFVKTQIPRLSRTRIQTIITSQLRRADGHAPKPATIVAGGDHYILRRAAQPEPPCPRTFNVLISDPRLYVIDKPAGLPVHASAKFYFNTLTRVLAERFPDEPELQICHRLDRETSGCLVVARDRAAAAVIKHAFATKDRVRKQYLAVVHGNPPWPDAPASPDAASAATSTTNSAARPAPDFTIDLPLRVAQPGDPTKLTHVRMLAGPGGLPAITRVRVERRATTATASRALVRCTLVTGRQHQIRAHLAALGYPIIGDKLYAHGDDAFLRYCNDGLTADLLQLFLLPRHALHAASVTFPHPTGSTITAEAPLPRDLASLLADSSDRQSRVGARCAHQAEEALNALGRTT